MKKQIILNLNDVIQTVNGELTLKKFNHGIDIGSRTSIINHLISKYNLSNYLEIGVRDGKNFNKINCVDKEAVDPQPTCELKNLHIMDSDTFFKNNKKIYDLIFIDGLHLEYQVDKDIKNSLQSISDHGFIILHDCNPPTEFHQREQYEVDGKFPSWNGTVWKSIVKYTSTNKATNACVVNCDYGIGILRNPQNLKFNDKDKFSYHELKSNRKYILNLISVNEFLETF